MLESIQLRNFQVHSFLEFELTKGVTTIIGPSDKGKSAILRAIKWVCLNQPAGNAFLQHGKKSVTVRLNIDGHVVERSYTNGTNIYKLDKEEFEAFGREVPETVANFLQCSNINFQGQHEAPFWFCETAGEVSRQLNQIVSLELVDHTLSNLASLLRKNRTVMTERQERLKEAKEERKRLSFVKALKTAHTEVKQKAAIHIKKRQIAAMLHDHLKDVSTHVQTRDRCLGGAVASEQALQTGAKAAKSAKAATALSYLLEKASAAAALCKLDIPDTDMLEQLLTKKNKLWKRNARLHSAITEVERQQRSIESSQHELDNVQHRLTKLSKERCPLCGKKLKS